MSPFLPKFVVVGNVNQGKSSIVAALIEDGEVPIDRFPGTTNEEADYSFQLGEQDLFTIIDTPGFQDARAALAWMKKRSKSPGDRPQAVRDFVAAHAAGVGRGRFAEEVRLLEPIVEGASIIYVVDASSRFQPSNEAEMEILRWTGQPAMALINRTRDRDHSGEWRPILEQFFNLVREFNAHDARFSDRLDLLAGFKEIRAPWRITIDKAVQAMRQEWDSRRHKSARVIAEFLVRALSHVEKRTITGDAPPPGLAEELEQSYQDAQRRFEQEAREEIERTYHHQGVEREDRDLSLVRSDLFSDVSWRVFGLSRAQLARYGLAWGALIGGGVDAVLGGWTFLTGAATGGLIGSVGGYFAGTRVAKTLESDSKVAKLLFGNETGQFLFKGPVTNQRYSWMLVDRALTHFATVRSRSHARQDKLDLAGSSNCSTGEQTLAATLPKEHQGKINKDLLQTAKQALQGSVSQEIRDNLAKHIGEVLAVLPEPSESKP